MTKQAMIDANYATFHDPTGMSSFFGHIKQGMKEASKRMTGDEEVGKLLSEITMPFIEVPSSIASKTFDYSPLGLMKGIYNAGRVVAQYSRTSTPGISGNRSWGNGYWTLWPWCLSSE